MTATDEKKMLRDIHSIAVSLKAIAQSMDKTIMMVSTEPVKTCGDDDIAVNPKHLEDDWI